MSITKEKRGIMLKYAADEITGKTSALAYEEDENGFFGSGELRAGLVRAGAGLSFSAAKADMLKENMEALGFERTAVFGGDGEDPKRIGGAFGIKRDKGGLTAAAVLRGTKGAEWHSNFDIGFSAEHRGYSAAADYAGGLLDEYIKSNSDCGRIRFFITGYSRGGAAADILAKRLSVRMGSKNVLACTFAAPNTVIRPRGRKYGNIYNIVRDEDLFTKTPPREWGYTKYGRSLVLTGDVSEGFKEITGESYIGCCDPAEVDEALKAACALAPDAEAYYGRMRKVGKREMSMYEYFESVAHLLADSLDAQTGEVLFCGMSSDYGELSAFMSAGVNILKFLSSGSGIPKCSVADSHSPAAYIAAMKNSGLITAPTSA